MADLDDRDQNGYPRPGLAEQVWRLRERQNDILARLDKLEVRVGAILSRGDEMHWKIQELVRRIENFEKKAVGNWLSNESGILKTILYGLLFAVLALAGGQFANMTGLLR